MDAHVSFPAYVPEDVRHYVTRQLDQFSRLYSSSQEKLGELRQPACDGDDEAHQAETRNEARRSEYWVQAAARVRRIVLDSRLRNVFELLETELSGGNGYEGFFHAALNTNNDYSEFRDAHRDALTVAQEIAVVADRLAKLLGQFKRIGISGPPEFFSVRELLRMADCTGVSEGHRGRWLADGDSLLGSSVIDAPGNDRLKMLWKSAPPAENLIRVMASAARRFEPYEDGPAGAALNSRQRNRKWEYLRAFIYELLNNGFRVPDPKMTSAVAMTATIVLDNDVSDDDVRKATKRVADYMIEEWGGPLPD
ncbi:hypothetical protein CFB81_16445 [Burkholderia sp. AU28863]|uniref:hypothetical protein n=1 Tax=Burkholderia sp. AU28863 TaxID=2015352 RepID=UPI000B7A2BD7|nr:hypothetical protein [Burkholderia sp. AU28863]OXI70124.1 hypothetical protein CFB81_16445 [Burkholderia sp. AU28863]